MPPPCPKKSANCFLLHFFPLRAVQYHCLPLIPPLLSHCVFNMLQKFQLYFPISPFQYFKVSGFEACYIGDKMQKVAEFWCCLRAYLSLSLWILKRHYISYPSFNILTGFQHPVSSFNFPVLVNLPCVKENEDFLHLTRLTTGDCKIILEIQF